MGGISSVSIKSKAFNENNKNKRKIFIKFNFTQDLVNNKLKIPFCVTFNKITKNWDFIDQNYQLSNFAKNLIVCETTHLSYFTLLFRNGKDVNFHFVTVDKLYNMLSSILCFHIL